MQMMFSNILAIYRKELQSYFASPLAYTVAGVFWLIAGIFFAGILFGDQGLIGQASSSDLRAQQFGFTPFPIDVPYTFLQFFLGTLGSLVLFILPVLSMGLYAEERKRGTLELLATSPITNWMVAIGKLLGVVTFFLTMLLPLLIYEAIVFNASNPPFNFTTVLVAHLGLLLLAAAILSLGMFVSSLTDSTILAAVFTFALVLLLWGIDLVAKSVGGVVGDALGHLSLLKHYTNLVQGVLDTGSLVLFASYIVLGVFLTAQSIEALRFQRS
ncbi:ABC transporter permease [Pantanalinema rosaneae CENA516]|uniref:ABC transporter permease n=1 Tax=Pantanalinema rosaneae TaxID=1620701 RepID=UPI003D6ECCE1